MLARVLAGYNVVMSPSQLQRLLSAYGYEAAYREDGFAECLLANGDEHWLGRGLDRERALLDAIAKAFPSRLSRSLLDLELAKSTADAPSAESPAEAPDFVLPRAIPTQPSSEPEPEIEAPVFEEPAFEAAPLAEELEKPPVEDVPITPPPRPAAMSRTRVPEAEALGKLSELRATIEADQEELGLCSPPRQRLVLLAWMARARAFQEEAESSGRIYDAVRTFAKTIGQLAKDWWPGNVPALQISSRPIDALKTLPAPDSAPPMTWAAVADLAELALEQMEQEEAARDRDDYGWADAHRLVPTPEDPDELLRELLAQVEKLAPLGRLPEPGEIPTAERLVEWIRKLRWLRDSVEDARSWGRLAGRMRFWARKERDAFAVAAREIEPNFVPERPWALVLRAEAMATADAQRRLEEEARRAEELGRVLEDAPRPEASPSVEELAAWLARALPFTDAYQAEVAGAMLPFRERVLELDPANIEGADRRIRRRLAKLRESLANPSTLEHPPASTRRAVSVVQPVDELLVPELSSDGSELRKRVVEHTKGRRAVFVSNRSDEGLRERIEELFDFEVLDWVEAEPRRIDALSDTIAAGAYDFVLGATGFMDHTVDGKLSRACKRTEARYIRVNRGRPTACLRAVARSLGELHDAA